MHRIVLGLLGALLILAGCAAPAPDTPYPDDPGVFVPRSVPAQAPTTSRIPAEPEPVPQARLDPGVHGRIVAVNLNLRFVVMEFPAWRLPAPEQRLHIYRGDQKVGEVKVTGPTIDTTVAGDLIAGEAQPGDRVREDY